MKFKIITIILILIFCLNCSNNKSNKGNTSIQSNDTLYLEKYDTGELKIRAGIRNKKLEGLYKSFYPNGNIKSFGANINDRKEGIWKFYDKNEKLVRVENYENDKVLFIHDIEDFNFKEIKLKSSSYLIKLPVDWKLHEIVNPLALLDAEKNCSNDSGICPSITITYEKLDKGLSYIDYIDKMLSSVSNIIPKFKQVDKRRYRINGREVFRIQYLSIINKITIGGALHFIKDNENIVMIFTSAENSKEHKDYLKNRLLFKEIVNSFH